MGNTFAHLWPGLERALQQRAASGLPVHLNIWDMSHFDPASHQVLNHPTLLNIAKQFGTPTYFIEEGVNSEALNALAASVRQGDPLARQEVERMSRMAQQHGGLDFYHAVTYADRGAYIYYPDPRGPATQSALTPADWQRFNDMKRIVKKDGLAGYIKYFNTQPPTEQENIRQFETRYQQAIYNLHPDQAPPDMPSTYCVDPLIRDSINQYLTQENIADPVRITVYGALHMLESNGLDDLLPGVNLAVAATEKDLDIARYHYATSPRQYSDLPDFLYLTESDTLYDMSTLEGRRALLGPQAELTHYDQIVPIAIQKRLLCDTPEEIASPPPLSNTISRPPAKADARETSLARL
tara:strand:- start:2232 stop:3290 length:1059 start_codon:yes stop_codon:yes gene_type:complete